MAARRTVAASRPRSFSNSLIRQAATPALAKSPPVTGNSWRKTASSAGMASVLNQPGHPRAGLEHGHFRADKRQAPGLGLADNVQGRPLALDEDDARKIGD